MIEQQRRTRRPPPAGQDYLRLTSAGDGREHRVREGSYTEAVGSGRCVAVCGHAVILCALAAPPGPPCSACASADEGAV